MMQEELAAHGKKGEEVEEPLQEHEPAVLFNRQIGTECSRCDGLGKGQVTAGCQAEDDEGSNKNAHCSSGSKPKDGVPNQVNLAVP